MNVALSKTVWTLFPVHDSWSLVSRVEEYNFLRLLFVLLDINSNWISHLPELYLNFNYIVNKDSDSSFYLYSCRHCYIHGKGTFGSQKYTYLGLYQEEKNPDSLLGVTLLYMNHLLLK